MRSSGPTGFGGARDAIKRGAEPRQRLPRGQIRLGDPAGLAAGAQLVEPLQLRPEPRLARVVRRQRGGVLGDAVPDLEREVRGGRAHELRELVLGGDLVDVLEDRHPCAA